MLPHSAPILITGMHRSGTSLLAEILLNMGVFIGTDLEEHAESVSFRSLSEQIFHFGHAFWDTPTNLKALLNSPPTCETIKEGIKELFGSKNFQDQYWGNQPPNQTLWGWKDPRALPIYRIWKEIFPGLRTIVIVRHGVDVAMSMARRARDNNQRINAGSLPLTLSRYISLRCTDSREAFRLWEEYHQLSQIFQESQDVLFVTYEELLKCPNTQISNIAQYLGSTETPERILERLRSPLNSSNIYPYQKTKEGLWLAEQTSQSPVLKAAGYHH